MSVAIAMSLALSACGAKNSSAGPQQVVATVNEVELTQLQLAEALRAMPSNDAPVAAQRAIDNLIDQELLVQQALAQKLDRDPAVLQMLESARRQTLARAYVQRQLLASSLVSDTDIAQFYRDNAGLFAQRKLYRLHNYRVAANYLADKALRADIEHANTEGAMEKTLTARNIPFESEMVEYTADKLPIQLIPEFLRASNGDILMSPQADDKVVLMQIIDTEKRPLTLAQATPYIESYLLATRGRDTLATRLAELRAAAKIEYVGGHEDMGKPALATEATKSATAAGLAPIGNSQAGLN